MKPPAKYLYFAALILFLCGPYPVRAHETEASDNALADLIESIWPSVVAVGTYYFNDVPKARLLGTGFVISNGNRIVTNHHVVSGIIQKKRQAYLRIFHRSFDPKGIRVNILDVDKFHDLAILGKAGPPLPALKVADNNGIREGHPILFCGYPIGLVLGLHMTSHTGIISAIAPLVRPSPSARVIDGSIIRHLNDPYNVLQIDATAFPGNSGSPVIRIATGEVVGVISQTFIKGKKEHVLSDPSGITYAIPAEFIKKLENNLSGRQ